MAKRGEKKIVLAQVFNVHTWSMSSNIIYALVLIRILSKCRTYVGSVFRLSSLDFAPVQWIECSDWRQMCEILLLLECHRISSFVLTMASATQHTVAWEKKKNVETYEKAMRSAHRQYFRFKWHKKNIGIYHLCTVEQSGFGFNNTNNNTQSLREIYICSLEMANVTHIESNSIMRIAFFSYSALCARKVSRSKCVERRAITNL